MKAKFTILGCGSSLGMQELMDVLENCDQRLKKILGPDAQH